MERQKRAELDAVTKSWRNFTKQNFITGHAKNINPSAYVKLLITAK